MLWTSFRFHHVLRLVLLVSMSAIYVQNILKNVFPFFHYKPHVCRPFVFLFFIFCMPSYWLYAKMLWIAFGRRVYGWWYDDNQPRKGFFFFIRSLNRPKTLMLLAAQIHKRTTAGQSVIILNYFNIYGWAEISAFRWIWKWTIWGRKFWWTADVVGQHYGSDCNIICLPVPYARVERTKFNLKYAIIKCF